MGTPRRRSSCSHDYGFEFDFATNKTMAALLRRAFSVHGFFAFYTTSYSGFGIINNFDNSSSNPNGVLSEDEIRSHPACLSCYYSQDNINPMLPTPLLSKEEWRMQQRFRGGNGLPFEGFADWKTRGLADDDVDNSPLFLVQPGVSIKKKENAFLESGMVDSTNPSMQASTEWLHRGPEGRVVSGCAWMCVRRKSFAEILQVLYRPTRHVAFSDTSGNSDFHSVELSNLLEAKEGLHSGARAGLLTFQSQSSKNSCACPSAVGSSLTRNSTSEIQLVGRKWT
ncbi:hypothetical protein Nepgr_009736 [Nepenthes gracilis]|uniref:Uncharacterized protein n=1 Tax=Nepenthes gracilis TaxID=150966 RepID=A0AAD3SBU4_NEPGR|nr:hypothetical protein Nepgr_009736 [Nepenthes gracilis]